MGSPLTILRRSSAYEHTVMEPFVLLLGKPLPKKCRGIRGTPEVG